MRERDAGSRADAERSEHPAAPLVESLGGR
ncbi:hypothetical protein M218_24185 [Burkholderia pseudomallei MSHR338]|nr:hypothetical protein M218_24185 [Burkholderia pseudomallei MSHR338]